MLLTLLLALVFILAVCALLYAAVGLIQNNKLFTTAPKDIRAGGTFDFVRENTLAAGGPCGGSSCGGCGGCHGEKRASRESR